MISPENASYVVALLRVCAMVVGEWEAWVRVDEKEREGITRGMESYPCFLSLDLFAATASFLRGGEVRGGVGRRVGVWGGGGGIFPGSTVRSVCYTDRGKSRARFTFST